MSPTIDPRLITFLYEHLESLDDLAVLVWLGNNSEARVSFATVAKGVGIDEARALEVLSHFASIGLVEERSEHGHHTYALDFSLPADLARGLGSYYGSRRPN